MPQGYICERVNLSDWEGEEGIGSNIFGSCWSECSNLLTLAEVAHLPGVAEQTVFLKGEAAAVKRTQSVPFA